MPGFRWAGNSIGRGSSSRCICCGITCVTLASPVGRPLTCVNLRLDSRAVKENEGNTNRIVWKLFRGIVSKVKYYCVVPLVEIGKLDDL